MRRSWTLALTCVLAAIAGCGDDARDSRPGGTVTRLADADLAVRDRMEVPGNPCGIAAARGTTYVTDLGTSLSGSPGPGAVVVLDRAGRQQRRVDLGRDAPCAVAVAGDAAVVGEAAGRVALVGSDVRWRATASREVWSVAAGDGDAWIADRVGDRVVQLDARTGRVRSRLERLGDPADVAVAAGRVWVALSRSAAVLRHDPRSGRRTLVPTGSPTRLVAASATSTYVVTEDDRLLRLDARTGRVRARRSVAVPADLAVAAGAVWFLGDDGVVLKLEPQTLRVLARTRVSGDPFGLAVDAHDVLVGARRR